MLRIDRFINELMSSNCYIISDDVSHHCLCIDPASEMSTCEIAYIESKKLTLDYIILTHEHTDHTWGVNSLVEVFPKAKVVCSEICKQNLALEFQAYFLLYYDNTEYHYTVCNIDATTEELCGKMDWFSHNVEFINTPGHSLGSISILIDGLLFTGDTIMQAKPYVNKRNGSKEKLHESVNRLFNLFGDNQLIYPGHGDPFCLGTAKIYFENILKV